MGIREQRLIRDRAMPLEDFPDAQRQEIERLAALPDRPPRWLTVGGGLAQLESRAWYEWHWQRGVWPDDREKIPRSVRQRVLDRDGLVCGLCGGDVDAGDVHIDHVVPVSRGGQAILANLQVTHSTCNMRKGSRV